ncbi:MAG: tRNA (adenosine(37)-N6)-threonylcarbamoyltransferase complex dimerization subunit type 1 TsaB [Prevotellaceae bacterium]|nr:tRNA (adenosine(37)-N6)-threonylcarbamoyltransferase complex dimerization subunit type 1 TsaB [Prevotellaceae bacterium]
MPCILHIETSQSVCSVALSQDGAVIFHEEDRKGHWHSVKCGLFARDALSFAESHAIPLDAVAVSEGPGSYTGLRIGFSLAKGVAYGRGVSLVAVPTLELLCVPVLLFHEEISEDALLAPMIDARRMEVYTALYDRSLRLVEEPRAEVMGESSFCDILNERQVCFFGDGAGKCRGLLSHPNALFIEGIEPLAKYMMPLAERRLMGGETADVAYGAPFYLKEFQATVPRRLI